MENRTGELNYNKRGSCMKIVEYANRFDMVVEFDCGYRVKSNYSNFKKGLIKNPYDKSLYGNGYLGSGKYSANVDIDAYNCWKNMIKRVYSPASIKQRPSYLGCKVSDEWLNFQNFAKWYEDNFYQIDGEKMNLDKDILVKNNKVYSKDSCCFVPEKINILFEKRSRFRGKYPIGVILDKSNNSFIAQCSIRKKNVQVRGYKNPMDAFKKYKELKEQNIKDVANEFKGKIPQKLYSAMIRYEIEIDD